jgi:hypothetical protein
MMMPVFARALAIFAISTGILAAVAGLAWWYHNRIAIACELPGIQEEPITCHYTIEYLGAGWPEAIALVALYFGLCCLVAWVWLWAGRRRIAGRVG